jgi:hypothetical protein
MSKFNVLSAVNKTADEKIFNRYQLSVGLKDITVLIPHASAEAFEAAAAEQQPQTMAAVNKLIEEFTGEIE